MWCCESREYAPFLTSAGSKLNRPGMLVVVKLTAQNLASVSVEFFAASERRATYVVTSWKIKRAPIVFRSKFELRTKFTKSAGLILILRGRALYSEPEGGDNWMASRNFRWYKWVNKTWRRAMLALAFLYSLTPPGPTAIPHAPHWCCHN